MALGECAPAHPGSPSDHTAVRYRSESVMTQSFFWGCLGVYSHGESLDGLDSVPALDSRLQAGRLNHGQDETRIPSARIRDDPPSTASYVAPYAGNSIQQSLQGLMKWFSRIKPKHGVAGHLVDLYCYEPRRRLVLYVIR